MTSKNTANINSNFNAMTFVAKLGATVLTATLFLTTLNMLSHTVSGNAVAQPQATHWVKF